MSSAFNGLPYNDLYQGSTSTYWQLRHISSWMKIPEVIAFPYFSSDPYRTFVCASLRLLFSSSVYPPFSLARRRLRHDQTLILILLAYKDFATEYRSWSTRRKCFSVCFYMTTTRSYSGCLMTVCYLFFMYPRGTLFAARVPTLNGTDCITCPGDKFWVSTGSRHKVLHTSCINGTNLCYVKIIDSTVVNQ